MNTFNIWKTSRPLAGTRVPCEVFPDGSVDLVFEIKEGRTTPYIFGTSTKSYEFRTQTDAEYIGARFSPGFLPKLDDYQVSELVNGYYKLDHVPSLRQFSEKLASLSEREIFLKAFISKNVKIEYDKSILPLVSKIVLTNGDINLGDEFSSAGKSARQIERNFKKSLGLSPQKFRRIIRLNKAKSLLKTKKDLVDIALECGYYDQSHMIKDFRELSGRSPSKQMS